MWCVVCVGGGGGGGGGVNGGLCFYVGHTA